MYGDDFGNGLESEESDASDSDEEILISNSKTTFYGR
jgi:hypothetical protein